MEALYSENSLAEISLYNNSALSPSLSDKDLDAIWAASLAEPLELPQYAALRGLLQGNELLHR